MYTYCDQVRFRCFDFLHLVILLQYANEFSFEQRVQIKLLREQRKSQVEISKNVKSWRRSTKYAIERFAATRSYTTFLHTTLHRTDHHRSRGPELDERAIKLAETHVLRLRC